MTNTDSVLKILAVLSTLALAVFTAIRDLLALGASPALVQVCQDFGTRLLTCHNALVNPASASTTPEEDALILRGERIAAIRSIRARTGLGLAAAKDLTEGSPAWAAFNAQRAAEVASARAKPAPISVVCPCGDPDCDEL